MNSGIKKASKTGIVASTLSCIHSIPISRDGVLEDTSRTKNRGLGLGLGLDKVWPWP